MADGIAGIVSFALAIVTLVGQVNIINVDPALGVGFILTVRWDGDGESYKNR